LAPFFKRERVRGRTEDLRIGVRKEG